MAKDVIITPASGKLDFYGTAGGSVLANINLTDNNDLSLSTTSGNLIIGDASRDVYIGDGTNEVDIVFEQNGEIRSVAGKYITVNAGTVNATGVAVNTTFPTAVMHVYGSTPSGTVLNVEGTNGSLFSVVDNLDGTLMSVNNNAGLPVLEVFSNDSIVGGRFGQNDFVVSSSGNIGIGVANPSTKIEVSGTVTATTFSGAGTSLTGTAASLTAGSVTDGVYTTGDQSVGGSKTFTAQIYNSAGPFVAYPGGPYTSVGNLHFNNSTANFISFDSYGSAAPGSTRSAGTKILLLPSLYPPDYAIGIESNALWNSVPVTSASFKWYGGTTNIATLTGDGRFTASYGAGGYTTPTLTLQVGTTNLGSMRFFPMTDGAGGYITFNSAANTTSNGQLISGSTTLTGYNSYRKQGAFQWMSTTSDTTSRFEFLTANGGTTGQTMTSRMAITAAGKVGIGTNTPNYPLEVNGAISLNATTVNQAILLDPENPSIVLTNSGADTVCSINDTSTHFFGDFNADGLYFDKIDIRVGIKTQGPEEELHVNGGIRFAPATSVTLSNNGDVSFERVSNTQLRIKMRGTDGVTRSTTLTLA